MRLSRGDCLGPYEVIEILGVGGMGEVYRARDKRLQRDVAVKIVPDAFAADPDRLARFEREARLLAALKDSHVAAIYDVEETNGIRALVLELVEGETLADRLAQRRLSLDEAVAVARQIADAVGAAHAVGIVHRDLKPANVKITSDGDVKVLDFGLAKEVMAPDEAWPQGNSPTVTSASTRVGLVLGTVAYMSPEQARGLPIDKRTDIWALGCILFEMLAGVPPFRGATSSDILVAVLEGEPAWDKLPDRTPEAIANLLRRCLEKDVRRRFHDVADVTIVLEDSTKVPARSSPTRPRARIWIATALAAAAALGAAAMAFVQSERAGSAPEPLTFRLMPPSGVDLPLVPDSALSPDGRRLAFVTRSRQLWVHSFADGTSLPLDGTAGALYPFWSHDGRSIGFFAQGKLKTVEAKAGALPVDLCDVAIGRGGTWNARNEIVFADVDGPLQRISATGGMPTPVTRIDTSRGETTQARPQFLPDGRHILYTSAGRTMDVRIAFLNDPASNIDLGIDAVAAYSSGYLVMERHGGLAAQPFDPTSLRLSGQPFTVAHRTASGPESSLLTPFSVSETGNLSYATYVPAISQLTWLDRGGKAVGTVGEPAEYGFFALSHDQSRLAVSKGASDSSDASVWVLEVAHGSATRVTFGAENDTLVKWSSDDQRIVFSSQRRGPYNVLTQSAADGSGTPELLLDPQLGNWLNDVSRDGRFILYAADSKETNGDLWILPRTGDRKSWPFAQTPAYEGGGAFSPAGDWVAYHSTVSGQSQIYLRPFPGGGPPRQISTNGGFSPMWRDSGGELYFVAPDQTLMAATFPHGSVAATPSITKLFRLPVPLAASGRWHQYAPNKDGTRFLAIVPRAERAVPSITVVENWTALANPK